MEDLEDAALALAAAPLPPVTEEPPLRGDLLDYSPFTRQRYGSLMKALDEIFCHIQEPSMIQKHIGELSPFLTYDPDRQDVSSTEKTLSALFDMDAIQVLVDKFTEYGKCGSIITDNSGVPLSEASRLSTICANHIRTTERGAQRCYNSDQQFGSLSFERTTTGLCHTGALTDGGCAIQLDGVQIASFLIGGVATSTPNVETGKIMIGLAKDIGADPHDMVEAYRRTRRLTMAEVQTLGESLYFISNFISQQASRNFAARRAARLQSISVDTGSNASNNGRNTIGDIMNSGLAAKLYALWWKPTDRAVHDWFKLTSVVCIMCLLLLPFIAAFSVAAPMSDMAMLIRNILITVVAPTLLSVVPTWGSVLLPLAIIVLEYAGPVLVLVALYNGQETLFNAARHFGRYMVIGLTTVLLTYLFLPLGFLAGRTPFRIIYAIDTDDELTSTFTQIIPDVLALLLLFVALAGLGLHSMSFAFAPSLVGVNTLRELLLLSVHVSVAFVGAAIGAVEFDDAGMSDGTRIAARLFAVAMSLASLLVSLGFIAVSTIWVIGRHQKSVAATLALTALASLVLLVGSVWSAVAFIIGYNDTLALATGGALSVLALLLIAAPALTVTLLHIRTRYAEELVFAIMFSETGKAAVKPLNVLRCVFKRGHRAEMVRLVGNTALKNLKIADLSGISVNNLELGVRPLVHHERKLFGLSGITPAIENNLYGGANMILRRACVAYSPDITAPLRLTLLTIATMSASSINTAPAVLQSISEECLSRGRLDHSMYEFAMRRYIEQMEHIYTLGGRDNAASFLEVQSKLSQARSHHLRTLVQVSKFWPLLLRRRPDLPLIIKHARTIGISTNKANLLYTRLFRRYPDNPTVREWYILFLDSVMQDHARAQQLRTETVDDDIKSVSSDGSGSSFSASSTGTSATGGVEQNTSSTFFRMLIGAAVINVMMIVIICTFLCILSEVFRSDMGATKDLHDVSFAVEEGSFFSSLLYLNDTRLDALDLDDPLATSISAAATVIKGHHDFLIDMDHGGNEYYYFYEPDEVPVIPARVARKTWGIAAGIANELDVIANTMSVSPADLTSGDQTTLYAHAQAVVSENFDSFAEIISLIQRLDHDSILNMIYVAAISLILLIVTQLALTVILVFWIIFRSFIAEVVSCDVSLTNCLSVSRAQVRRQMRLVGMAKSKFKDIDVLDFDQDLQEDLNDELDNVDDDDYITKKQLSVSQAARLDEDDDEGDDSDEIADTTTDTRKVRIAFQEVEQVPNVKSAFEMAAEESSGSDAMPSFAEDDSDEESPRHRPNVMTKIVKKLKRRGSGSVKQLRKQMSTMGTTQILWSLAGVAGLLLAMAAMAGYIIYGTLLQMSISSIDDETLDLLDRATVQYAGSFGYLQMDSAGFAVNGTTSRLDSYVSRHNSPTSVTLGFTLSEFVPKMWMSDEMVTAQTLKQQLLYYMDVAVSIAAYGHGFTSDITTGLSVDWNYTGETYYAQDVEEYSRSVWYTNKTSDTTLAAADQLALAQAILFDDKVSEIFTDIMDNMFAIPSFLVDAIDDNLGAYSFTTNIVTIIIIMIVATLALLPAVVYGARPSMLRSSMARRISIIALACLVAMLIPMLANVGFRCYVVLSIDPDSIATASAELSSVLEQVIDVDMSFMYHVQRYVFTGDESILTKIDSIITTMQATTGLLYTLSADATQSTAFVNAAASHNNLVNALDIAVVLAASANGHTIMNDRILTRTWNSSDSTTARPVDATRFTNETYDLARSDAEKQAMAESLCLTDPVTYADYQDCTHYVAKVYTDYRDGILGDLQNAYDIKFYATFATIAILVPVLGVVTFVLLPLFTTAAFTRSIAKRGQDSKHHQKQVLNRTLRSDFIAGVGLLLSVTVLTAFCASSIMGAFVAIYRVYVFVSNTAKTDSLLLKSGTRAALSYEHPASVHPNMLAEEITELESSVFDAFNSGYLDYVFAGAFVDGLSPQIAQYTATLTRFESTSVLSSDSDRSATLIPVLKETYAVASGANEMFNNRYDRMDLLVSFNEVVMIVAAIITCAFIAAVYTIGLRAIFRHLMSYSGSLNLLQSYLVR
ncbi:Sensory domain found in PocR [Carpediemonas membranifera]|uniref:Sensory domain found in PocR n=1 Tax=Carpediemonas membranifera TaxID=201153 RepID=A0A8J6EAE1_9EUKA|nr:Sensory domain found in PocR [Carpediemonas membranifera]|eukprot:KAG9394570.1 Sensory domain found in PocR [Carpediemonas membranifera]